MFIKKFTSTLLSLTLIAATTFAQIDPDLDTKELPFKSLEEGFDLETLKYLKKSKKQRAYRFELKDYNAVLYKPTITVTSKNFKIVVPDALKNYVALADFEDDAKFGVDVLMPASQKFDINKQLENRINEKKAAITLVKNEQQQIKNAIAENRKQIEENKRDTKNAFRDLEIEKLRKEERVNLQQIQNLDKELASLEDELRKLVRLNSETAVLGGTLGRFNTEYSRLKGIDSIFQWLTKSLENDKDDHTACLKHRDAALVGISRLYGRGDLKVPQIQEKFSETLNTCVALKESLSLQIIGGRWQLDSLLQESVDKALVASEDVKAKRDQWSESIKAFARLYPDKISTTSSKYQHRGDYAQITIKLASTVNPKDTVLKQQKNVLTKGGLDVDFSTGLFYNSIYKYDWFLEEGQIKKQDGLRSDYAWGALINFSLRASPKDRLGLSVGTGISLIDGNLRYLVGGHYYGALKNAKDIWGISGGLCLGKRNFLSATVSDDGEKPKATLPDGLESVPTYDKISSGFYLGIFYNFSR